MLLLLLLLLVEHVRILKLLLPREGKKPATNLTDAVDATSKTAQRSCLSVPNRVVDMKEINLLKLQLFRAASSTKTSTYRDEQSSTPLLVCIAAGCSPAKYGKEKTKILNQMVQHGN